MASWQACSSLLPRASKVAPQREAEDTAEGAAGYDGQDCSAADVFVLLLEWLRQALHALLHTSACTQSCCRAPVSVSCIGPRQDEMHADIESAKG